MRKQSYLTILVILILLPNVSNLLFAEGAAAPNPSVEKTLRERCLVAIEGLDSVKRSSLKQSAARLVWGNYSFDFVDPDGGTFFCHVCDETNRNKGCVTFGLVLKYRPADGELRLLPAELDRKCAHHLFEKVASGEESNVDMFKRIVITPEHTSEQWIFRMLFDGTDYRCVIRKTDGDYRVEKKKEEDWRALVAGKMF